MGRRLLLLLTIVAFAAPGLVLKAQQQPSVNPQPQGSPGILRGVVVREGTSEPIRDVRITVGSNNAVTASAIATTTLVDSATAAGLSAASIQSLLQTLTTLPGGGAGNAAGPQFNAITDGNGRFTIEGIPAGQYAVIGQREGYFGGQQGSTNQTVPPMARGTTTIASQQTAEISLTMIPGAAVSGRVLGANGMPVSNVQVELLRLTYTNGARTLQTVSLKPSDDRGEYRHFQLAPGEYYLAVQPRLVAPAVRGASTNGVPQEARTYYPSATDARNATPIMLRPGDELTGMNLQIQSIVGSKVSGRVVSQLPANAPVPQVAATFIANRSNMATLTLLPRDPGALIDQRLSAGVTVAMASPNDGAFEIPSVPPGFYDLYASLPDPTGWGPAALPGQATQPMGYGRAAIDVRGGDLGGITISVHQGVEVKGLVLVDGKPALAPVRVSLQPADSSNSLPIYTQIGRGLIPIQQDGSFLIPVVPEATYRMQATILGAAQITAQYAQLTRGGRAGQSAPATPPPPTPPALPATAYIADVRQGGASVYDNGISIGTSLVSPLEILVNTNGGTIRGTVLGAGQQPLTTGAMVVLMPPQNRRQNLALYKTAQINAQGAFTMNAVPPGLYKLFAWDSIPSNAYQNPDFVKPYEDRGVSITVQAGATISQGLTVIPAEKR